MECKSCVAEHGELMTSNDQHTDCVFNEYFSQQSVSEVLFEKGIALCGSSGVAVIFMAIAVFMQYSGEKSSHDVAKRPRIGTIISSFLCGSSFGSEVFLVMGLFSSAPLLASTMVAFRSLHFLGGVTLMMALFGSEQTAQRLKGMLGEISTLRSSISMQFSRENMKVVGVLALFIFCDLSMVTFMPWKASRFVDESKGFPCISVLKLSLTVKTIQSTVSVFCQIYFLVVSGEGNLSDPATSPQAKALFFVNIGLSLVGVVMSLLTLCLQERLLGTLEEELEAEKTAPQAPAEEELSLGDIYADNSSCSNAHNGGGEQTPVPIQANPMHASR
jgi:hypothetical protein